ncbi:MAG TPA: alpha-L-glutamate ligase [Candidatus Limnocylindria bacterium]|nr:alpha-L-glutamate ligase [Candidatus Limnocylindria bacterium]
MIVVVSYPEDAHAARVIGLLHEEQHEVLLLNLADLPGGATVSIDYADPRQPVIDYRREGMPPVDLASAAAIWWRRPQLADSSGVPDYDARMFTANEWNEAANGIWHLCRGRWMNRPDRDEVASRKAYQLRIAAEAGLRVPRTLITSDPGRARAFIEAEGVGRTIFKTFSATHAIWRETRVVTRDELEMLDAVRLAPVIFQELIPAGVDVRVTIVGDRLFPAAIDARHSDYPTDFRMSLGQARTEPTTLPDAVGRRLLAVMSRLGLAYGAVDMRRTPEGDHVFLEVNTAGEFLFVEDRTGQPISRALAEWLAADAAN